MHVRWIPYLFAIAGLCLVLVACGSEDIDDPGSGAQSGTPTSSAASPTTGPTTPSGPSTSIADLTTLDWQLAEIDGEPVLDGSVVTMTLVQRDDNIIRGYSECTSYLAGFDWDEQTFAIADSGPFSGIDSTERVCQHFDGGPEQDAAFFAALAVTETYHATDEQLVLSDGSGPRLAFIPRPAVTVDPTLTGDWQLTDLNGNSPLPGKTITLSFDESRAGGNDGCNGYGGELLVASDGRLIFGDIAKEEMACTSPEGVMEQGERFTRALDYTAGYEASEDQLRLFDHNDNTTLTFERQNSAGFDPALAAHHWGLIEVNGQPAVPGSLVTLELAEGSIGGSDGCNAYGGELIFANDGTIEIATDGFTQTDAGCRTDDLLAQADLVTTILVSTAWYQIDGDRLTIGDAADNMLVFGPQAEVLLIGSSWSLPMLYTELPGGEIRGDALIEGTQITLTFNPDGTLAGNASCNTYGGAYTLDGPSIAIDSLFWTEMACPDPLGIMEQEMTYLDTLQAVTAWEIGMNGLTLETDDGRVLGEMIIVAQ